MSEMPSLAGLKLALKWRLLSKMSSLTGLDSPASRATGISAQALKPVIPLRGTVLSILILTLYLASSPLLIPESPHVIKSFGTKSFLEDRIRHDCLRTGFIGIRASAHYITAGPGNGVPAQSRLRAVEAQHQDGTAGTKILNTLDSQPLRNILETEIGWSEAGIRETHTAEIDLDLGAVQILFINRAQRRYSCGPAWDIQIDGHPGRIHAVAALEIGTQPVVVNVCI